MNNIKPQLPDDWPNSVFIKRIKELDSSFLNYMKLKFPEILDVIIDEEYITIQIDIMEKVPEKDAENLLEDVMKSGYYDIMTREEVEDWIIKEKERVGFKGFKE